MTRPRIAERPRRLRCAIYTRKSSEEGLDQAFNSLHAQREACEAYILSQAGEGWIGIASVYDDGGFSGGNIERPGLKRLLADIGQGQIDVVVVYKVDRLTRALSDFAKIVEIFDASGVSFVSVTQAFNTTSSMGRLTLNVLLSFAQFEREVTGERIRDKIAASKAKGIWMGGMVPLGYDVHERSLIVNEPEAERVRAVFRRYLEVRSVPHLKKELDRAGERSKSWVSTRGRVMGGAPFTCGALFHILQNRMYLGLTVHKGDAHPGQHSLIVEQTLFDAVQAQLTDNRQTHHQRPRRAAKSPLTGLVYDAEGVLMSPSFTGGVNKQIYRYYVSAAVLPSRPHPGATPDCIRRVPARPLEAVVLDHLQRLSDRQTLEWSAVKALVHRIEIKAEAIHLVVRGGELVGARGPDEIPLTRLGDRLGQPNALSVEAVGEGVGLRLIIPMRPVFRGGRTWLTVPSGVSTRPRVNQLLVRGLRNAHRSLKTLSASPLLSFQEMASAVAPTDFYTRRTLPLGFLAPDIQKAILEGRQPREMTMQRLLDAGIPLSWEEQRRAFGFTN